jgi:rhamnogalacturonyl hydrolase YesR
MLIMASAYQLPQSSVASVRRLQLEHGFLSTNEVFYRGQSGSCVEFASVVTVFCYALRSGVLCTAAYSDLEKAYDSTG